MCYSYKSKLLHLGIGKKLSQGHMEMWEPYSELRDIRESLFSCQSWNDLSPFLKI